MTRRLHDVIDQFDEMIIKMVIQAKAIRDMCAVTGMRSTFTVFYRLKRLEEMGYIQHGRKHSKTSRRVTRRGLDYLSAHGYISREDGEAYLRLYGSG